MKCKRYELSYFLLLSICLLWSSCQTEKKEQALFERRLSAETNIHFNNEIIEDNAHNILNFTNLYTGSGVGIGDFNQDGLPDVFFGGNQVSSRLYLNKGNLSFEDVTAAAGVNTDRWVMGVAVVDINADGWPDIYLSISGNAKGTQLENQLFINRKNNTFTEEARAYGIADSSQCTHANFFDYDKDGDLDLFVIVNPTDYNLYNVNNIRKKKVNGESASTDKLYRNNGDNTFTDVSKEAGILIEGYSLSLNVSDLNGDNWPDVYVTNDFMTNDILYVNNQDGTFTNRAAELMKHTSFASMGIDVADINNDGLPEVYVLDMFPEDNYRQKMIMPGGNYDRFQYILKAGYEPQYSRNTLQLNNGDGTFSEIGQMANLHKTDWSWSALLADYDNDGFRDLFVTNGFRRDLGNLDYINYSNASAFGSPESRKQEQLERIVKQPGAKLLNYIYKNDNGLTFTKKTEDWGFTDSTYSHGAAFADLDRDGDLDILINNVSQPAFIYENKSNELSTNHAIQFKLIGSGENKEGLGAKLKIKYGNGQKQYAEYTPYRGYESTVGRLLHFGLGEIEQIDELEVQWPDGTYSNYVNLAADTLWTISYDEKKELKKREKEDVVSPIFAMASMTNGLAYSHEEDLQIDFKTQSLLPHQHSRSGPCLAVGDVNGDGLEDAFVGGAAGKSASFFLQQRDGSFITEKFEEDKEREDVDALFFDADQDGDLDLYVVSGGVVAVLQKDIYQDRLYFNDGEGDFVKTKLPQMNSSGGVVAACDYDQDGDLDLFVGGRVSPGTYPEIPTSYLLNNNKGSFTKVASSTLEKIGMVSSALWTDFDQDGDEDLMLAGEFMALTFIENNKGELVKRVNQIPNSSGWWNTLLAGDFDDDGDIDYLAGNLGLNTNYKASPTEPLCLYAKDFDKNGSLDPVLCQYTNGKEYTVPSRDNLVQQIPPIKVRFNSYDKYATAEFNEVFNSTELKNAQVLKATIFESCYVENKGDGTFELKPLPLEMQIAPITKFHVEDIDQDGKLDALAVGNSYATEVVIGRYDAFTGALLKGKGNGNFAILRGAQSGFLADKDATDLAVLKRASGEEMYMVGNNSDSLQLFSRKKKQLTLGMSINN